MSTDRARSRSTVAVLAAAILSLSPAAAQSAGSLGPDLAGDMSTYFGRNAVLSLTIENDAFTAPSTDRNYTNGLRLSYVSRPKPFKGVSGFIADRLLDGDEATGMFFFESL